MGYGGDIMKFRGGNCRESLDIEWIIVIASQREFIFPILKKRCRISYLSCSYYFIGNIR